MNIMSSSATKMDGALKDCVKKVFDYREANKIEFLMFGEHELKFELDDDLDEFFLQKAQEELRETPENVAKGHKELAKLIAESPDLLDYDKPYDEQIYQIYLRPSKWYAESAFALIKRFYRYRQTYSRIFVDFLPSKQKTALCSGILYPMPIRAKDGSRIMIVEGGRLWKPKEHPVEDVWKGILFLLIITMLEVKTQIAGARVIIDVEGLSLSQITYLTPSFGKMVVEFVQKCLPLRLKSVHIVNQSFIFNVAFAIFKPIFRGEVSQTSYFSRDKLGNFNRYHR
nr:PREDICTED: alpha-tocopherol transfer protein-like isoform X1 [Linepithema humile]XP_012233238.1 PREDICTED: alpha-tocopherol transfer protein-like isoform X1 [Linepithema humile]XP_012233239.1 PREDICTED: alpha-tocopherol transfer protein-like isoform X1 [Linepithema humile]XP_012233240.1 PREDICTED: alpha-tocopherol transfer protein-like isoform X1 [Linepithema humile]